MQTAELDLEAAFARLAAGLVPIQEIESLAPGQARGRVLARAITSAWDLPSTDVAAMDGYALRASDAAGTRTRLHVAGRILAGQSRGQRVEEGSCVRIMTGAPMPEGSDAVALLEDAAILPGEKVEIPGPLAPGANRRLRGEHVHQGDTVLAPGRRLRAVDIGLACAVGAVQLEVFRGLRVGVLSTGDELRDPPAELPLGAAYDGNRPMLLAALQATQIPAFDLGICPDDPRALERILDGAWDRALDVLLISGGAAKGDADVVRGLSGISFVPVNLRPGRGIALARPVRDGRAMMVLGLPGNAVAAYVLFYLLALPTLARIAGCGEARPPQAVPLPILRDLHARAGRVDLRRARLHRDERGGVAVELLASQGSAMLRSVCDAQALVAVGPAPAYRAGDLLPVYLLEGLEV